MDVNEPGINTLERAGNKLTTSRMRAGIRFTVRPDTLMITGIFVLAFFLRINNIQYGLPYSYHFDEKTYTGMALNLGAGVVGVQVNPTGYSIILLGEYIPYFVIGSLLGNFSSVHNFGLAYHNNPAMFILLSRLTSAIFGALTIWVIYLIGKEMRSRLTGYLAAFLLAIAFIHVRDSHFAVPDITMTFFTSMVVLFCVRAIRQKDSLYQYLAAGFAGFAIAIKWSALPVILPVGLIALLHARSETLSSVKRRDVVKKLIFTLSFFLAALLMGSFPVFSELKTYYHYMTAGIKLGGIGSVITASENQLPVVFYLRILRYGLGSLLTIIVVIASGYEIAYASRKKDWGRWLILSFPVAYLLIILSTTHYFDRYLLPFIPFALLFSADLILSIAAWLDARQPKLGFSFAALVLLLVGITLIRSNIRFNYLLGLTDTRTLAKEWIEANIPDGARIGVDYPIHVPPLATKDEPIPGSKRIYDVTDFRSGGGLWRHPLEWYQDNKFDYLITTSFIVNILNLEKQDQSSGYQSFYTTLDRGAELVKEFRPYSGSAEPPFILDEIYGPLVSLWERDRPGPTIKIYRLHE